MWVFANFGLKYESIFVYALINSASGKLSNALLNRSACLFIIVSPKTFPGIRKNPGVPGSLFTRLTGGQGLRVVLSHLGLWDKFFFC
jgi:hypothetical protein